MEPLTEQLKTADDHSQLAGKTTLSTPSGLKLVVIPHRLLPEVWLRNFLLTLDKHNLLRQGLILTCTT